MNKFLWKLFEIDDEEEFVDLSRRGFLKGMGAAAVLGAAAPKLFLPPIGGWTPAVIEPVFQFGFTGFKEINAVTFDYIVPTLADNVFKASSLFSTLRKL
jgi:TAT (twin-arginine translocation) pathway signal sequence